MLPLWKLEDKERLSIRYVPDNGTKRALLFFSMILLSATQVLIKATLIIILASIASRLPVYYLLGDMAFYLMYKVVRRDFTYWLPLEGVLGLVVSVIVRVMFKLVVDFAAIIQLRHPQEVSQAVGKIQFYSFLLFIR